MPTPVAVAKQCLTAEAAHALDEAVAVARGRGHAQTTSLHAVSAFLSLPSSPLRDACFRARTAAFCYYPSPRSQLRALDFALSLSLDRSPASQQRVNEPPISNSLMAAIKRSQANQRRQPDSFCFKQEHGKEQLGTSGIKVEIQHLIVAILDDPIVSRVFNEAGFSSFDIKLAMVRPLQSFWRYNGYNPRQRRHQSMFLCNLEENLNPSFLPFRFPFSGDCSYGDEDFKRIGDVLARKHGRNPLLFGVCAYDALQAFLEAVERSKRIEQDQFLPSAIRGVSVASVEREILKFVNENSGEELIKSRFEELGAMVKSCCGPGLLVCFGDLKAFVKEDDVLRVEFLSSLVMNFKKLLEVHRDRAWLIGCATYEIYLKFLNRFPSIEKDWDLQPLAITSMKLSKGEIGFKSSLMGSFVPFAGFFPSSSDFKGTTRSSYQLASRSDLCNEKHAEAVTAGYGYNSVADQCQTTIPSWLRMTRLSTSNRSDIFKAKDDARVLTATTTGCHSKWENTYPNFHYTQTSPLTKVYGDFARVPSVEGQSSSGEEKLQVDGHGCTNISASCNGSDETNNNPALTKTRKNSLPETSVATDLILGVSSCATNDFKCLFEALIRRIDQQEVAVRIISQTISNTRASNGKLKGSRIRGDIWMNFTGHDRLGMRKTTLALAEVVCGSKDSLIHVDLSSENGLGRRRTTVDHIADRLSKTPLSIVCLENLRWAHLPVQDSLLRAVRSGRFSDSHGREVGISNAIFVLIETGYSLEAKPRLMQITVATNAVPSFFNKRKLHSTGDTKDVAKRSHKESIACLDLNLPADDTEFGARDIGSDAWFKDLSGQVDATVVFEPFDYDHLEEKLSGLIQGCFSESFCSECTLEIDGSAMDQILAGAFLSERKTDVEDWSDKVLSKALSEARKRYHLASHCAVKLATCRPSLYMEEQEQCGWLPSKINLNCQP